jgi:hypothetical protein
MRTLMTKNMWRAAAAVGAAGALAVTAACSSGEDFARVRAAGDTGFVPVAQQMGNANGQVLVNCEPQQRTLVRQVVVNGQPMSQVECVTANGAPAAYAATPAQGYAPVYNTPRAYPADYGYDTRVVSPAPVYRPASTVQRRAVIERPRAQRSVKKSAIIIGSSAGVGAGVGAAVGGKKGALLGAVIGGGGATLWDQLTRHK